VNIDQRANTSAASIPIAMSDAKNEGKLQNGDTIVLAGFGAGLTWASIALVL
jgi:3-oxoacyl-[acyl-carrier-protein] synthase-3